ncbi:MAG: hypothetical protein D6784_03325 [Chloroflexi bacterium]|nr:MAG: hypothetical protein D6784_03325 [Chloroflexota bacterium]
MAVLWQNFGILWFSVSVVVLATAWYAWVTVPLFFPDWWRREIVDAEPVPVYHKRHPGGRG